jgi:hypothetical protein
LNEVIDAQSEVLHKVLWVLYQRIQVTTDFSLLHGVELVGSIFTHGLGREPAETAPAVIVWGHEYSLTPAHPRVPESSTNKFMQKYNDIHNIGNDSNGPVGVNVGPLLEQVSDRLVGVEDDDWAGEDLEVNGVTYRF